MNLTKEEFKAIRFLRECVVEIPSLSANEIKFNGSTLVISGGTQENENRNAVRFGRLAKMPLSTNLVFGNMFACELDARIDDMVYFDSFWSAQEMLRRKGEKGIDNTLLEVEGVLYLRLPAISIVAAKRGDEVIALNGFVIAEPIAEEDIITESGLYLPAEEKPTKRARVVAVPKSRAVFRDVDFFKGTEAKVGDIVRTEPHYQLPLDRTYSSETPLVRILSAVILSIE